MTNEFAHKEMYPWVILSLRQSLGRSGCEKADTIVRRSMEVDEDP